MVYEQVQKMYRKRTLKESEGQVVSAKRRAEEDEEDEIKVSGIVATTHYHQFTKLNSVDSSVAWLLLVHVVVNAIEL